MILGPYLSGFWNKGITPKFYLKAWRSYYDDATDQLTGRHLTEDTQLDIAPEYIDLQSIHYEASVSPDGTFTPGSVTPGYCTLNVFQGGIPSDILRPGNILAPVPHPAHASDYHLVYQLKFIYDDGTNQVDTHFCGFFIITNIAEEDTASPGSYKMTLQSEMIVFENMRWDPSPFALGLRSMVRQISIDAGFGENVSGLYEITDMTVVEPDFEMSARQCLSYILQINGCYLADAYPINEESFEINCLVEATSSERTFPEDYEFFHSYAQESGIWSDVRVYPKGTQHETGSLPSVYIIDNNPFVSSSNKSAIRTKLTQIMLNRRETGFEVDYMLNPYLTVGSFVKICYMISETYASEKLTRVNSIEWNGGAFMKIKEFEFDNYNRV